MNDRAWYTTFIEQTYFGNVEQGKVDAILACFLPDAEVVIRHGDSPERLFAPKASDDRMVLGEFYEHLCGNYEASFRDFRHFVDPDEQRAASHFKVQLRPKPDGLYADAGVQNLLNCNFFEFKDELISHMIVYYVNPQAGEGAGSAPTGYPQG